MNNYPKQFSKNENNNIILEELLLDSINTRLRLLKQTNKQ